MIENKKNLREIGVMNHLSLCVKLLMLIMKDSLITTKLRIFLEVTEEFLKHSIEYYKGKYGNTVECNGYVIIFRSSIQIIAC